MAQIAAEARFWDRIARKYAAKPIDDQDLYEQKLALTQRYLKPTDRVLELGCGTGSTALVHAPHVAEIEATDFSGRMIAIAQEKAAQAGVTNVTFFQASAESYAGAPGSFDVVLALNLIHLVEDPQATLRRIRTLLKPGGLLVASTACVADIMPAFRFFGPPLAALRIFPKVQVFRGDTYETWLAEAGYEVLEKIPAKKRSAVFHILRSPS